MPSNAPLHKPLSRYLLLPALSLLLLIGLSLVGPAATAAPAPAPSPNPSSGPGTATADHSAERKHKKKAKKKKAGKKNTARKLRAKELRAKKLRAKKARAAKVRAQKIRAKKARQAKKRAAAAAAAAQPAATGASRVDRAMKIAVQQVGDPYKWGASGPGSFDCSGLMQYSFAKAGIKIPRTAAAQSGRAHRIARSKMRPGDLLYFTRGGRVYHTAMFLRWKQGTPQIVHAPGSGKKVRFDTPFSNSWFAGSMR